MTFSVDRHRTRTGGVELAVAGELDLAERDLLVTTIREALSGDAVTGLTVDLSAVAFCDASGIGALLTGRSLAEQRRVPFRVVGPQPHVERVFAVADVLDVLTGRSSPSR